MPETHDLGPLFVTTTRYSDWMLPKRFERAVAFEDEPPYREGRGWSLKVGRIGLIFGRWYPSKAKDEDEAFSRMLMARDATDDELEEAWGGASEEETSLTSSGYLVRSLEESA